MVSTIEEVEEEEFEFQAGAVGKASQLNIGSQIRHRAELGLEASGRQAKKSASAFVGAAAAKTGPLALGAQVREESGNSNQSASGTQNYLSSLITRSSILLNALKQQCSPSRASQIMQPANRASQASSAPNASQQQPSTLVQEQQQLQQYFATQQHQANEPSKQGINYHHQSTTCSGDNGAESIWGANESEQAAARQQPQTPSRVQVKPPLPPPPPPRGPLLRVASSKSQEAGAATNPPPTSDAATSPANSSPTQQHQQQQPPPGGAQMAPTRRHAIQEQSLERDAALSLKARDLKHKRTSSIKSALRHANLGSLRGSSHGDTSTGSGGGKRWLESIEPKSSSCGSSKVKSMPYELFEPPVTQRTFQRSKRRGAMSDPKRQMSADTIGLRQLTDEYLKNAGVKPISSSGQCSLVALTAPLTGSGGASSSCLAGTAAGTGGMGGGAGGAVGAVAGGAATSGSSSSGQSQFAAIETQLYQASKRTLTGSHRTGSSGTEGGAGGGSEDSLSTVAVFPGNLPWQSDVSVQCELLQAPQAANQEPPYETTGDILNTIAGPFRGTSGTSFDSGGNTGANHLSATLKRGLTVISQHHLTPGCVVAPATATAALNVVGSLKKSLSNTLDISRANAAHLHSQDSLPAYSNLLNEPESPPERAAATDQHQQASYLQQLEANQATGFVGQQQQHNLEEPATGSGSGLIGQLASKLGRQSSKKKFSVSRKGLQRALSFDCRGGYKRLDGQQHQQQHQLRPCEGHHRAAGQLLSASSHQTPHNRSTLCLDVDRESPRPYLPQSASQVDFQLPLLPYHKMQEAIVSQRLIDPRSAQASKDQITGQQDDPCACSRRPAPDADELICGGQQLVTGDTLIAASPASGLDDRAGRFASTSGSTNPTNPLAAGQQEQGRPQQPEQAVQRDQDRGRQEPELTIGSSSFRGSSQMAAPTSAATMAASQHNKTVPPRLVLDIPTISTPTGHNEPASGSNSRALVQPDNDDDGGEEVCAINQDDDGRTSVIVCLPSPNVAIDPGFNLLPNSSSFCIDPKSQQLTVGGSNSSIGNTLNANDIFSHSKSLIKRPSTMLVSDTMNQVAEALNNTGSRHQQAGGEQQVSVVLRNRRQAIVPPKLATDGSNSDGEQNVGKLVDVEDSAGCQQQDTLHRRDQREQLDSDEATVRALRRKRSGGGAGETARGHQSQQQQQQAGSPMALPTFCIEQEPEGALGADGAACSAARQTPDDWRRPDSQATNAESIVSSGSSLSLAGKRDFTVTSPGGLTVSFGSSRGRRRSSIAVIPQMQICPGDLLVYSKQLIDRMNQSDETEPPQFLTIDDKKAKNIWSSFKLFDNRTLKARNELLCSLEDVLATLQPSTFVDEQLSHYKGMLWNEFLYETESRRSASSEVLSTAGNDEILAISHYNGSAADTDQKPHVRISESPNPAGCQDGTGSRHLDQLQAALSTGNGCNQQQQQQSSGGRETLKATMSSGPAQSSPQRSREPGVRSLSSRFREKPKLKRGQTVDSVFRIPLIPSSPLKHAQQHQQTPTAHLEEHALNEDDERSSTSAASVINAGPAGAEDSPVATNRKNRSSSTRSRAGSSGGGASRRLLSTGPEVGARAGEPDGNSCQWRDHGDSSFETDDAMDLIVGPSAQQHHPNAGRTPHQIVRQSSLSTLSSTITRTEQKRQRALWDLFQSECTFFFDHLLTLKNVYMEPLKKIQVEGFAMFADPDVLFGNLDELCCGVYDFCKEFLYIIMRTLKTRPEELNATDVLIKLYKKNPKIDHLRGVYHRYTLNYINALTYLESLRRQVEFVEFEKWSSRDVRCKKLQLTDLLVAPVQHIMRVPIILKDIESHTENPRDRDEIRAILAVEEASLRELDDKMRWLKNFERLLEIQKNICWPSVLEQESKLFIPEFLKEVLSKQPCEKLIVSPRRQIVHEGTLSNLDLGKACDMHVILFDDMLLLTRRKKGLTKKPSTVCKTNSGGPSIKDDGSFKYIVYKQPLSLDRFYVHDVQQVDAQSIGLKHLFLLIVMNRFQQITNVHSFSAPNDDIKQTWLFKIKKTAERWKKNFSNSSSEQPEVQQHVQQQTAIVSQSQVNLESCNNHSEANTTTIHDSVSGQQQQQYPPLLPKVVNLSAAMRQATEMANVDQPAARRPTETLATLASSPKQAQSFSQQAQSSASLSNSYPTETSTGTTIERAGPNSHNDYGGRESRSQRQHQHYQYHQQQSIELVVTSAPGNSHDSSTNVSSLAPAH